MVSRAAPFIIVLVIALAAIGVAFLLGMKTKSAPVLSAVRRTNRAVINPLQMRSAGTPGAYASVIHHVGRTTGRPYETPVQAVAADDGFVVPLPYGSHAEWLKNVLASGDATIVTEGRTYRVTQPAIVDMGTVEALFPPKDQRSHRLFDVDRCLRVRRVGSTDGGGGSAQA